MSLDFQGIAKKHLSPALAKATQIVFERGEGPYLFDTGGKRYLDFVSGIAVNQLGHCHPKVVAAAKAQIDKLIHGSFNLGHYPSALTFAHELAKVTPGNLDMFFFSNTGAEAVDGALKLARWKTRRPCFIAFQGAFHGRTLGATSVTTSSVGFRARYAPFLPTVYHVSYPYCFRCHYGNKPDTCGLECLEEINRLFKYQTTPEDVAAVIFEPVQGEGGYIVPPVRYMTELAGLCQEKGILLIFDEIQTGFGRTGKMFAAEHFNIVPDIMCLAKGIASGFPLSAVAASKDLMGDWAPGSHGTTFGANPVSCAAALAVLEVFREENILNKCNEMGGYFKSALQGLQDKYPVIGDVRGLGLMLAVEFVDTKGNPDGEACKKATAYCAEHGLLFFNCGTYKNCIRFITPLNVAQSVIDEGLAIFADALKSLG
ncbi:MAG: aspartate aminotransferase family protein [Bacillota bacterium]